MAIKYRLGFYASTPAYKTVLDTHGWGDLQPRVNRLTKEGNWEQLPHEISDEMLQAFAEDPQLHLTFVEKLAEVVGQRLLAMQALWLRELQRSMNNRAKTEPIP